MDESRRKWMTSSQKTAKGSLSIWQFIFLLSAIYMIGLLISHNSSVVDPVYWSGYKLERLNEHNQWVAGNRFNIKSNKHIQSLQFKVNIDESQKWQRPIGLKIGGPFSAEVVWDNELIGSKGKVGINKTQEAPGPIDALFFVPQRLLTQGVHHINVRLSTQHLIFDDASVFHFIELGPYRDNARRELSYYITPLLILSALIIISVQSIRIGINAGNITHTGLGVFGFFIIILLISEVSRAIVNYPYHFHELRGFIGWFANTAAGLTLVFCCFKTVQNQYLKYFLYAGIGLVVITYFIPIDSGDERHAMEFMLLATFPAAAYLMLLFKHQASYFSTLPLFVLACIVSNLMSTALFLDSFQFVAAFILIAGAWGYLHVKEHNPKTNKATEIDAFTLKEAKGQRRIPVAQCIALKGEGNYTTLIMENGDQLLHQDGLGALMTLQPKAFVRVHKSYAVNLTQAKQLRSAPGSKYWLEMSNQLKIPVSRYRASEVRNLLLQ
jgi:DNA-binding LytR/AlgR family response regulator